MPEKTEAQKKAQKKYMEKFMVAQVRMERDKYSRIQTHAEAQGQSVNAYINTAIDEKMSKEAVESPIGPADGVVVFLPSDTGKRAPAASEGPTEGVNSVSADKLEGEE